MTKLSDLRDGGTCCDCGRDGGRPTLWCTKWILLCDECFFAFKKEQQLQNEYENQGYHQTDEKDEEEL